MRVDLFAVPCLLGALLWAPSASTHVHERGRGPGPDSEMATLAHTHGIGLPHEHGPSSGRGDDAAAGDDAGLDPAPSSPTLLLDRDSALPGRSGDALGDGESGDVGTTTDPHAVDRTAPDRETAETTERPRAARRFPTAAPSRGPPLSV